MQCSQMEAVRLDDTVQRSAIEANVGQSSVEAVQRYRAF
jgi:hypothetical protein